MNILDRKKKPFSRRELEFLIGKMPFRCFGISALALPLPEMTFPA